MILLDYLFLISGILCFGVSFIFFKQYKIHSNLLLGAIFLLLGFKSFLHVIIEIEGELSLSLFAIPYFFLDSVLLITTLLFVSLKLIYSGNNFKSKHLFYFIPTILVLTSNLITTYLDYQNINHSSHELIDYFKRLFTLIFILSSFRIILFNNSLVYSKEIKKKMFIYFLIFVIFILIHNILEVSSVYFNHNNSFILSYQIIKLLFLVFLLTNPKLLYYWKFLIKISNKNLSDLSLKKCFSINKLSSNLNSIETKISEKYSLDALIIIFNKIENSFLKENILRDSNISLKDCAKNCNIPLTHYFFLNKYHIKLSFTEFKNQSRIIDSTNLIQLGFLKTNTLDSLAVKVGFKSYSSFFTNFKKYKQISPKEYINNI
ncbi:hypothetical protein N9464_02335 [Flavobacteriaceae bacterium]|nr:hypothetical protein [Flavobacteriaceae bacterium]